MESLTSRYFVVHFELSGRVTPRTSEHPAAVPASLHEAPNRPTSSCALSYAQLVIACAERALDVFTEPPFGCRNPSDAKPIQIRIQHLPGLGRVSRKGIIYLHNQLDDGLLALTIAHELFHLVQYRYQRNVGPWRDSVIEGGAVLAEQCVTGERYGIDDEPSDAYRAFSRIVREPQRPLTLAKYDCGLFWDFLGRQADLYSKEEDGPRAHGPGVYEAVLQSCSSKGYTAESVRDAVRAIAPSVDLFAFRYDGPGPHAQLLSAETVLGNFAIASCLADNLFVSPDPRYVLSGEGPMAPGDDPSRASAIAYSTSDHAGKRSTVYLTLGPGQPITLTGEIGEFASSFYCIDVAPAVHNAKVTFSADSEGHHLLLQVGLVDDLGRLVDIIRTDQPFFARNICLARRTSPISRLMIVVTGVTGSNEYRLGVGAKQPHPNVTVTRWNSIPCRELELAPLHGLRPWTSPDILNHTGPYVDGNEPCSNLESAEITVRNTGNADACQVSLSLFWQRAAKWPRSASWRPLQVKDQVGASVDVGLLPANSARVVPIRHVPVSVDAESNLFMLVTVFCSNDHNRDTKSAITRLRI